MKIANLEYDVSWQILKRKMIDEMLPLKNTQLTIGDLFELTGEQLWENIHYDWCVTLLFFMMLMIWNRDYEIKQNTINHHQITPENDFSNIIINIYLTNFHSLDNFILDLFDFLIFIAF